MWAKSFLAILFIKFYNKGFLLKIFNKKQFFILVLVSNFFNIYSDQNKDINDAGISYVEVFMQVFSEDNTENRKEIKPEEVTGHIINEVEEVLPIEYSIKDDDNFVYIKIKSNDLKDWTVEGIKRGDGIEVNVDSPQMKINDLINCWQTRILIEKKECDTEKCKSEFVYSLPAKVDLQKKVQIKKIREENCVLITLEKDQYEKIYRIQVIEE